MEILGMILVFIGFILLFLPGQGLLSILTGLVLMDFPGKYQLESRLIARPAIFRVVNRIRAAGGKPPFKK